MLFGTKRKQVVLKVNVSSVRFVMVTSNDVNEPVEVAYTIT